jgi:flagellar hook-associated protein 3 FlgL
MRVTQALNQAQFLAEIQTLESNLSQTQSQITSNQSFTTASQNPTAAGSVNNYNQALAQSQQYVTNSNSAQTRLSTEDSTLSQVQTQLQSLRDLALEPFTQTAGGAAYNGDQGQRQVQIAAGQTVADGDSGDAVFNQIPTGNGTFTAAPLASNTGTGVLGAATLSAAAGTYDGGTYSINFTAPGTYEVRDSANALVTSGTYTDGDSISFRGVQVALSGQPAAGDSFSVAPSTNQSVFATVQNIVGALQTGGSSSQATAQLNNAMAGGINNIDQALSSLSNVRASVGARLNSITTQQSVAGTQQIQLQSSISSLQSLDYASAITTLDQQNTTLSAALQAYTITQGLSLFKYL